MWVQEREKYDKIMFDFRYLKSAEYYDEKVDADPDLVDLDEEFRETHFALLERFYKSLLPSALCPLLASLPSCCPDSLPLAL